MYKKEKEGEEQELKSRLKDLILKKNKLINKLEPFNKSVGFIKEYEKVKGSINFDDFFALVNHDQIDLNDIPKEIEIALGT